MKHYLLTLLFCIFLLSSTKLLAQEFAYVTDSLKLRLYSQASDTSEVLLSIESGDSVEILEIQSAFSKIVTNDGSVGWVKSAFLVEEPPEKLLYYSVSEQNRQLKEEVEALKNTTPIETASIDSDQSEQIAQLQVSLNEQQELNLKLQQQLENTDTNLEVAELAPVQTMQTALFSEEKSNLTYLAIAIGLLFAGLLLGLKIARWRMRRRLHGFSLN